MQMKSKTSSKRTDIRTDSPGAFLLRGRALSQHQTVILWIIHSEGDAGLTMRRKDIEQRISSWFDITSSAISKALRSLARAELPYLQITEDPRSGREKLVTLTREGQRAIEGMIERTEAFIARIVEQLTDEEIRAGLLFMQRVSDVVPELADD